MKSLAIVGGVALAIVFMVFAVTCTVKAPQTNLADPSAGSPMPGTSASPASAETSGNLPLQTLRDVPLSGGASRFDYQSFDANTGRLYIAHLGDGVLTIFDANKETVVGDVKDLSRVHGVIAVPDLHRIYASATGSNELAVIDDRTLQILARVPAGDYPDGIAYAPKAKKLYVSDLHGKTDTVIDANTNQRLTTIALGGGAGNTQYDSASEHIFVTVHGQNQLAEIDPTKDQLIARYPMAGCSEPHGLLIDSEHRLAFVACEENAKLAIFDLDAKKMTAIHSVGADPDVLAFDKGFGRLYVSAESGIITIFDERGAIWKRSGQDSSLLMPIALPWTVGLIASISHCRMLGESQSLESQCALINSYDERVEARFDYRLPPGGSGRKIEYHALAVITARSPMCSSS